VKQTGQQSSKLSVYQSGTFRSLDEPPFQRPQGGRLHRSIHLAGLLWKHAKVLESNIPEIELERSASGHASLESTYTSKAIGLVKGGWWPSGLAVREGMIVLPDRCTDPQKAAQLPTSENRRALLTDRGFLSKDRTDWTPEGKSYFNGLFKMLHTDGSHPGLSDDDHSTFRLHLGLITGRTLLRGLHRGR
jgi:hypothetical protein